MNSVGKRGPIVLGERRVMQLAEHCRRRICHEVWNVGIVDQAVDDIVARGILRPIRWFVNRPPGVIFADPACWIDANGERSIFVEAMKIRDGRGEIWTTKVAPGQDPAEAVFTPALQAGHHMSYPFPFLGDSGDVLLSLESWQAGKSALWREAAGKWHEAGALLNGRPMIDPTLWRDAEWWWLFCSFRDDGPDNRLHLFYAKSLSSPWYSHPANPIVVDFARARPAGPLFMADGLLIRPAQDCSSTYGGAVVLNAIEVMNPDVYHERPVRRLSPPSGPFSSGLHTLCPAGDVTLVDGKTWRFDSIEFSRRLLRKIGSVLTH